MEKKIEVKMEKKDIHILINNEEKYRIMRSDRKISAQTLFNIIDYHRGDQYTVIRCNPEEQDPNVLDFFAEMIEEITSKLNQLQFDENA